jgi:predicted metal-dependent hydrolase
MPHRVTNGEARDFVTSRLSWIARQRRAIAAHTPQQACDYSDGAGISVWGRERTIHSGVTDGRREVRLDGSAVVLSVREGDTMDWRIQLIDDLLRRELRLAIPDLIHRWEPAIGVNVAEWRLRRMTSRWGSCNIAKRRIWLNVELATRAPKSLESVVVHEMVHLIERRHNAHFYGLMDTHLPDWRERRQVLNAVPPPRVAASRTS